MHPTDRKILYRIKVVLTIALILSLIGGTGAAISWLVEDWRNFKRTRPVLVVEPEDNTYRWSTPEILEAEGKVIGKDLLTIKFKYKPEIVVEIERQGQ